MSLRDLVPFYGLYKRCKGNRYINYSSEKFQRMVICNSIYFTILFGSLSLYCSTGMQTHEWSVKKQLANAEKREALKQRFKDQVNGVFSPKGYADLDRDGVPSVKEYVAVLDKLGVDKPLPRARNGGELQWSDLQEQFTQGELERLVQVYEPR